MTTIQYRVQAAGCEMWDRLPGHDGGSIEARAAHTLRLVHGRDVRHVRQVAPGLYRGLVGSRVSATIAVRVVDESGATYLPSEVCTHAPGGTCGLCD